MDNKQIGTVVKIPNDTTIVIHTPKKNVARGDKIVIYETLSDITDLSGNFLGTYDENKATLEVTENNGDYVIARKTTRNELALSFSNSMLKSYIGYEKINVNQKDNENLTARNKQVSVGDKVKKLD